MRARWASKVPATIDRASAETAALRPTAYLDNDAVRRSFTPSRVEAELQRALAGRITP